MAQIYANAAAGTITDNPLGAAITAVNSANFANLPAVVGPDYLYLTLDPTGIGGLPEIVQVTAHTAAATVCTVVRYSQVQAGLTAASGRTHVLGTIWRHSATKSDMDEIAFRKLTTIGDMLYASAANTTARLAKGTTGLPIVAGATVPGYAALDLAGVSPALLEILCPAGTVRTTVNATADTGWALFNQTLVGAQSAYPVLWGKAPAAWKVGADLILPNLADRDIKGAGTTTLGASGGANTKTITSGNLPVHTHLVDPPNTAVAISDPGHVHGNRQFATHASFNEGQSAFAGNIDVANTPVTTGITATVDIASFASGNGAFANTAMDVTNAHLALVYQIKVH